MNGKYELLVIAGPLKGQRFAIGGKGMHLGRSSACEIAVKDPALSRNHCLIEERDGQLWVTDLASANGTCVNGMELGAEPRAIKAGDTIAAGETAFRVEQVGAADAVPKAVPVSPEADATPRKFDRSRLGLWAAAGLAVLGAGWLILNAPEVPGENGTSEQPAEPVAEEREQPAEEPVKSVADSSGEWRALTFEQVTARPSGISRLFVYGTAAGVFGVSYADVPARGERVTKAVTLTPEKCAELAKIVADAELYKLEPVYAGEADAAGGLRETRLRVARSSGVLDVRVTDGEVPEALRTAGEALLDFVQVELGKWTTAEAPETAADVRREAPDEAAFLSEHFRQEAGNALLFVCSEPSGAEIRCNGIALGTTPRAVASLTVGRTHVLEFAREGYRSVKLTTTPESRSPVTLSAQLPLHSGTIVCVSEPEGAEVVVNGSARGVTPVTVANVPFGQATVSFRKAGYCGETRTAEVTSDGRPQTVSVKLTGIAATLRIESEPKGARVFVDGEYQGKTPTSAPQLAAGAHKVRVELDGHAAQERTVTVANGVEASERFTLAPVLGRMEVVTEPAGARVTIDGKVAGVTRAVPGETKSAALQVSKVPAGTRTVTVALAGYGEITRKVKVPAEGVAQPFFRLGSRFTPDTEVELVSGSVIRGKLVGDGQELDGVHLETSPGVEQIFPHDAIRERRSLRK